MSVLRVIFVILTVVAALLFAGASTLLLSGVYQYQPIKDIADKVVEMDYTKMIRNGAIGTVAAGGATIVLLSLLAGKII